jgi:hypothetical protein
MQVTYYEYLRDIKDVYKARGKMIDLLKKNKGNIKLTARIMKTSKNTVKKIKKLYEEKGLSGLEDKRQGPEKQWKKIGSSWEKLIRREFKEGLIKTVASFRLFFNTKYKRSFSYKLYWRICSPLLKSIKGKPGNYNTKKKKHHQKAYWREKYQGKVFRYWQTDPKYLDDIEMFWPQILKIGLPKYQLGFKDVVSGSIFFFYTYELNANVMANAVVRFLSHLKRYDIPTDDLELQTDNDATIISGNNKTLNTERSVFTRIVEDIFEAEHTRIPKGACWKQGYIESYNWICELEFYSVEHFATLKEFLSKAFTYQLIYNLLRQQPLLGNQTPYQVAKTAYPNLKSTFYTDLPPIIYKGDEPAPGLINQKQLANHAIMLENSMEGTLGLKRGHLFWEESIVIKVTPRHFFGSHWWRTSEPFTHEILSNNLILI